MEQIFRFWIWRSFISVFTKILLKKIAEKLVGITSYYLIYQDPIVYLVFVRWYLHSSYLVFWPTLKKYRKIFFPKLTLKTVRKSNSKYMFSLNYISFPNLTITLGMWLESNNIIQDYGQTIMIFKATNFLQ